MTLAHQEAHARYTPFTERRCFLGSTGFAAPMIVQKHQARQRMRRYRGDNLATGDANEWMDSVYGRWDDDRGVGDDGTHGGTASPS
jgi:hypothetical protein